jgi:hypothetical protein
MNLDYNTDQIHLLFNKSKKYTFAYNCDLWPDELLSYYVLSFAIGYQVLLNIPLW